MLTLSTLPVTPAAENSRVIAVFALPTQVEAVGANIGDYQSVELGMKEEGLPVKGS